VVVATAKPPWWSPRSSRISEEWHMAEEGSRDQPRLIRLASSMIPCRARPPSRPVTPCLRLAAAQHLRPRSGAEQDKEGGCKEERRREELCRGGRTRPASGPASSLGSPCIVDEFMAAIARPAVARSPTPSSTGARGDPPHPLLRHRRDGGCGHARAPEAPSAAGMQSSAEVGVCAVRWWGRKERDGSGRYVKLVRV
jgi:hypothetical protein